VHIPWRLMSLVALATDRLSCHGPITTDELNMLKRENFTPHLAQFVDVFGFEPVPFSSGVTERSWSVRSSLWRASRDVNWKPNASPLLVALGFHHNYLPTQSRLVLPTGCATRL
jgi:hypothetical protein